MKNSNPDVKVQSLVAEKFDLIADIRRSEAELIGEINRKKAQVAKIHAELARLGRIDLVDDVVAW